MSGFENNASSPTSTGQPANDNSKLSFAEVMRVSFGMVTLEEVKAIVSRLNKVVIDLADGLTLLHIAAQYNRGDLIEYLCGEKHHPTEVKTIHGETPLDQAAWKGFIDASLLLLKYGADVDCQTNLGYSPLHRCAFYRHSRLASLFCLAGADQTLRDEHNQTAYEVAVEKKNHKVASLLQPIDGVTGGIYATNNPKHPNFRPEARAALFQLYEMERSMAGEEEEEQDENGDEDEEGEWEDIDDDEVDVEEDDEGTAEEE